MITRFVLLLAITIVVACDSNRQPDDANAAADTTRAVTGAAAGDPVLGRWRARVPDSVFIRRGACPFECCRYAEWALRDAASIFAEPRMGAPIAFEMPDSTRFKADSGFVRITKLQLLAVTDTVDQPARSVHFLPGDTLVVLDYIGEGHWRVWQNGRVYEVEGFWGAEGYTVAATAIGNYEREWWTHITTTDNRTGWLLIQPPMMPIGADTCSRPPYWLR